jgi:hypothetical protein
MDAYRSREQFVHGGGGRSTAQRGQRRIKVGVTTQGHEVSGVMTANARSATTTSPDLAKSLFVRVLSPDNAHGLHRPERRPRTSGRAVTLGRPVLDHLADFLTARLH